MVYKYSTVSFLVLLLTDSLCRVTFAHRWRPLQLVTNGRCMVASVWQVSSGEVSAFVRQYNERETSCPGQPTQGCSKKALVQVQAGATVQLWTMIRMQPRGYQQLGCILINICITHYTSGYCVGGITCNSPRMAHQCGLNHAQRSLVLNIRKLVYTI